MTPVTVEHTHCFCLVTSRQRTAPIVQQQTRRCCRCEEERPITIRRFCPGCR